MHGPAARSKRHALRRQIRHFLRSAYQISSFSLPAAVRRGKIGVRLTLRPGECTTVNYKSIDPRVCHASSAAWLQTLGILHTEQLMKTWTLGLKLKAPSEVRTEISIRIGNTVGVEYAFFENCYNWYFI
jgi:hypothetical protein